MIYKRENVSKTFIYTMISAMLTTIHGEKMNAKVLKLHQREKKIEKPI